MTKQYKKPEDMIDYNAELDTINGLMSIFFAYNQQQQEENERWTAWPEWELCLTSMDASLHFEDEDDSLNVKAKRRHWLSFFESSAIPITIEITLNSTEEQTQHHLLLPGQNFLLSTLS